MSDSLSNPAFIIRLFTETSTTLLTSLLTLRQWCLSAIGPFLITLLLGGCFAILFIRTQFELDELQKDNSFRRKERAKNNDLKRQILKTELCLTRNQERISSPEIHVIQEDEGEEPVPANHNNDIGDELAAPPWVRYRWWIDARRRDDRALDALEHRAHIRQFMHDLETHCV